MSRLAVALAVLATACTLDNVLGTKPDDPGPVDSAGDTAWSDTGWTRPTEVCNGLDDDGDGVVDEGFPDLDHNGRVDCLDGVCPALHAGVAGAVPVVETCVGTSDASASPVIDPWRMRPLWSFRASTEDPTATAAWATPSVGNLDDDDGDGLVDEDDIPDVVVPVLGDRAVVVAIDGVTGAEKWAWADAGFNGNTAIADVTGDGRPDVVATDASDHTVVLDADGSVEWTATELAASLGYHLVTTADLDGDSQPEVISDNLVLDGATGALLWEMRAFGTTCPYLIAAVGDVDADGLDQEVAWCGVLYDSDGTELWDSGQRGAAGMWPFLVQADGDPEAEIGFVGEHLSLWNADGTVVFDVPYTSSLPRPGPPCVGDFDGDGLSEVAFPASTDLYLFELDGTEVWSMGIDDSSGLSGCSGFDFDRDGALEILVSDQIAFTVFDGTTGATRITLPHRSITVFEYPVVADIDHDGAAEVLFTNNRSADPPVVAWEHDGDGWAAAGPTWAVHDFAVTNVLGDGTVPAHPERSWDRWNVYRARPQADDPSTADLVVSITDVCVMDCVYGPVAISFQVANQGGAGVDAGLVASVYAVEPTGDRYVTSVVLPAIPAGERIDGITVDLTVADVGADGFAVRVDDDGAGTSRIRECDETNNRDAWNDGGCD